MTLLARVAGHHVRADEWPVLFLPLIIETKFNVRLLRFMDCGVADYNAPIVAADRTLSHQEFHEVWVEVWRAYPVSTSST